MDQPDTGPGTPEVPAPAPVDTTQQVAPAVPQAAAPASDDEIGQLMATIDKKNGTAPEDAKPAAPPPVKPKGSTLSDLWDGLKDAVTLGPERRALAGETPASIAEKGSALIKGAVPAAIRGVSRGVNQLENSVISGAKGAVKAYDPTGEMARSLGGKDAQDSYMKFMAGDAAKQNPLAFLADDTEKTLGPEQGGALGLVTGGAQFMTAAAVLPQVGAGFIGSLLKGGAAMAFGFDPHMKRMSDAVQDSPMANPFTDLLSSKDGDSEAVSRMKNAAEGMMLQAGVDALVAGAKYTTKMKAGDAEGAAQALAEVKTAATTPNPADLTSVTKLEDGTYQVAPTQTILAKLQRKLATTVDPSINPEMDAAHADRRSAERLANTDVLTGLPNGRARELALPAAEADPNMGVAEFDLNNFKETNHGPAGEKGGDAAIKDVASSIQSSVDAVGEGKVRLFRGAARGDNFTLIGPKDLVDRVRAHAEAGYGEKTFGGAKVSLTGVTGNTSDEALAQLQAAKAARKAGGGVVPPAVDGPVYDTPEAANNAAVTLNFADKAGTADREITPDQVAQFQARLKTLGENPDPRDVAQLMSETGINFKYIHSPLEAVNNIKALADVMPVAKTGPISWEQTAEKASHIFPDTMTPEEVMARAKKVFGDSDMLPAHIDAMRVHLQQLGDNLSKLSALADGAEDNPVAQEQLAEALQTLHDFHESFRGTSSNVGRALQVHQRPVGSVVNEVQAQVLGADVVGTGDQPTAPALPPRPNPKVAEVNKAKADVAAARDEIKKSGINTETVTDPLALAADGKPTTRTVKSNDSAEGVTANDFSLARARGKAVAAERRIKQILSWENVTSPEALDNASLKSERVKMAADAERADPSGLPEMPNLVTSKNPIEELSKWLDQADSHLDTQLEKASKEKPVKTQSVTEGKTPAEIRAMARQVFLADGSIRKMLKATMEPPPPPASMMGRGLNAAKDFYHKAMSGAMSFRMEAMLSGPHTVVVKATSDLITMLQRPAEFYLGGVPLPWRANTALERTALRQQGADMLAGMWGDTSDAWQAAKQALMKGSNILDPGVTVSGEEAIGTAASSSHWWNMYHVPSRLIIGVDEFSKQMDYRAYARQQILAQARSAGITDAGQLAERLSSDMPFAFKPNGSAANDAALEYARQSTFTNGLDDGAYGTGSGSIGQKVQTAAIKHPAVRVIVPFVRTPTNIFRYQWERTPVLNTFNKQFSADIQAGGNRAAVAQAKTEIGTLVWTTGGLLAASGAITGGGPQNPDLRKQWIAAGHQPYSIKLPGTDRWVQYNRVNPLLMPFEIMSDIHSMSAELSDHEIQDGALRVMSAVVANLSNKTYNQGISAFMSGVSSGDPDKLGKLMNSLAASYVPNILHQVNPDDALREVRDWKDNLMARVPGFSTTLEPRRNIFGEKILAPPGGFLGLNRSLNPFTLSAPPKDHNVAEQLVLLGKAMPMPAETEEGGKINLTDRDAFDNGNGKHQSPYDRMLELMSTGIGSAPPLRTQMEKLVNGDQWKKQSDGSDYTPGGMKYQLAANIITAYQGMARAQVLKEYPKLQTALKQSVEMQARSMTQGQAGVDTVTNKYSTMFIAPPKTR